jgi:choline transport protein
MSEEIASASTVVPHSILTTVILNGFLGLFYLLVLLFTMGSVNTALSTPTGVPLIEIYLNVTGSKLATTAMTSVTTASAIIASIAILASTSRLTWAFARDNGLPYSGVLRRVHPKWNIPIHSITLSAVINVLLSLLMGTSLVAFEALISISVFALYATYLLPIVLILWRRIAKPRTIRYGPFALGRLGIWINTFAVVYLVYTGIFLLFPQGMPVTPATMNYAVVFLGATVALAVGLWFWKGKREYRGPLKEI